MTILFLCGCTHPADDEIPVDEDGYVTCPIHEGVRMNGWRDFHTSIRRGVAGWETHRPPDSIGIVNLADQLKDIRDNRDPIPIGSLLLHRDDKHIRPAHECHDLMEKERFGYDDETTSFLKDRSSRPFGRYPPVSPNGGTESDKG